MFQGIVAGVRHGRAEGASPVLSGVEQKTIPKCTVGSSLTCVWRGGIPGEREER
jgi:hypothetical protein